MKIDRNLEVMTIGGGCFWCIEAIFYELQGVEKVVSGYSGGKVPGTPTYKEVCSGLTGHAEVVQITFDANIISYEDLLLIFMTSHDPTTSNTKDIELGSQYRSVIFYHNDTQKEISEKLVIKISADFNLPITTEIVPVKIFHAAEEYHQGYFANNKEAAYCKAIITPKLAKLHKIHTDKLRNSNFMIKV